MLRRLILTTVVVVLAAAAGGAPARADHVCHDEEVEVSPGVFKLVEVCPPHGVGGEGDPAPQPVGGDESEVICVQSYWPAPPEALATLYRDFEHRGTEVWGEAYFDCSDGSERSWWICTAACSGPEPEPDWRARLDGLVLEAIGVVDPPLPELRHTFDRPAADGQVRAVVRAETWWWADAALEPITVHDRDGPVWVEVTATPGPMTIDPGGGSGAFSCPGPGLAYDPHRSYYDQVPGEPRGACVHVYEQTFDEVTATMSITWELTYEGFAPGLGNVSGTLTPIVRQEQVSFPVRELQSVIVS